MTVRMIDVLEVLYPNYDIKFEIVEHFTSLRYIFDMLSPGHGIIIILTHKDTPIVNPHINQHCVTFVKDINNTIGIIDPQARLSLKNDECFQYLSNYKNTFITFICKEKKDSDSISMSLW